MRVDTNFFGTVPMPDAGDPAVAPTARRYGNDDVIACYENMLHWSQTADGLGFDTVWLTEHHFQHEGYEVLPNLIMFGVHGAARTKELRFARCSTWCRSGTSLPPGRGLRPSPTC